MRKESRDLLVFFAATFLWTWAFYLPMALQGISPYGMPWMILLILGGAGPSIIGVVMMLRTYDRQQQRDFWRRSFSCARIGWKWWLLIFLIFPVVFALAILIDRALGGLPPGFEQFKGLMANPVMWPLAAFISFMSGPWSEEFGWRGFALDHLRKRFKPVPGAVGLGLIWGVWHLPLYFMPGTWHAEMGFKLAGFWTFLVMSVAMSLLMLWVYRGTNHSILSGMLLHFASNFTAQLIVPITDRVEVLRVLVLVLLAAVVALLLTRKAPQQEFKPAVDTP